jgi:predicted metal-dependent enzyme (double-stranded beta helix superfamily)
MNAISRPVLNLSATPLEAMLADIALAANAPLATRHRRVAEAITPSLGNRDLLAGRDCPCNPQRYCRHLLHNNPVAGYAVIAIVWTPGQMSPVHAHRTWCAFGVHRGWLAETYFSRDGQTVLPHACTSRAPGTTGHAAADPNEVHRLANLGTEDAISIHVYGVAFDDFGTGVNEVYAA